MMIMNNFEKLDDNEINITQLIVLLWANKLKIILISCVFVIGSIIYVKSLPNTYTSTAVLSPASSSGNDLSSLASQYSGLSALAGMSLPSNKVNKVGMALENMKSFTFFESFVSDDNFFYLLQAPKDWIAKTNTLIIDQSIYDSKNNKWVSDNNFAIDGKPSMQTAHRSFLKKLSLNTSNKTSFITISFEHYSPYVAQKVVQRLISKINEKTRSEDIYVAENSILFLDQEIQKTQLKDLRLKINDLKGKQIEMISIAKASPEYLVKVLSPPIASELKSGPNKFLIVLIISLFGFFFSIVYVLNVQHFMHIWKNKK